MCVEPGFLGSIHLPSGCLSLVGGVLEKAMIEMPSSTPGGGEPEGQSSLWSLWGASGSYRDMGITNPSTHTQPYHNNPTEFLKIYSVISMSPMAGGEVKHSDTCGISPCFFGVSFKKTILISFFFFFKSNRCVQSLPKMEKSDRKCWNN